MATYVGPNGRSGKPPKITEDDPRWNPATMGNKKWGRKYRGALNYSKGRGKAD